MTKNPKIHRTPSGSGIISSESCFVAERASWSSTSKVRTRVAISVGIPDIVPFGPDENRKRRVYNYVRRGDLRSCKFRRNSQVLKRKSYACDVNGIDSERFCEEEVDSGLYSKIPQILSLAYIALKIVVSHVRGP